MTDNNTNPPKNIRVSNVNVDTANIGEVRFTRSKPHTGDTKGSSGDLLDEVSKGAAVCADSLSTLNEQLKSVTATLKSGGVSSGQTSGATSSSDAKMDGDIVSTLKEMATSLKSLVSATNSGAGGGVGGGDNSSQPGSNTGPGDAKMNARVFTTADGLSKAILDRTFLSPRFEKFFKDFEARNDSSPKPGTTEQVKHFAINLAVTGVEKNFSNLIGTTARLIEKLTDFQSVTQKVTADWKSGGSRALSTGITEIADMMFWDLFPAMLHGGDSLKRTLELVDNSLTNGLLNPLGIVGADLLDVAENLRDTRLGLRDNGSDAFLRMGAQEANTVLIELLTLERRRDVLAKLGQPQTNFRLNQQVDFLQMIATNTGKSVEELIKANRSTFSEGSNRVAAGILSAGSADSLGNAVLAFRESNMGRVAEFLEGIMRSGGSMELWMKNNDAAARDLAMMGLTGDMDRLQRMAQSGASVDDLMRHAASMQGRVRPTGLAGADQMSSFGYELAGEAGLARDQAMKQTPETSTFGWIMTALNDFRENMVPSGTTSMVAALLANTAALGINTIALLGGGGFLTKMGGMIKGVMGAGAGAVGKGLGFIKGIGGAGAGLLAGMGGKAAGLGKGLLGMLPSMGGAGLKAGASSMPLIGAVLSAVNAGRYAYNGDWASAGMSAGAGALSFVPGWGTAASLGINGALIGRDILSGPGNGSPSVGPAPTSLSAAGQQQAPKVLTDQTSLLQDILTTLSDSKRISEDIERNTRRRGGQVNDDRSWFSSIFSAGDDVAAESR